jgi:hypothetical protein
MKTIKFAAFLLYDYYSGGRRPDSTPYFRTIASMTLFGFMHLMQLLIVVNRVNILSISASDGKGTKRIIMFFVLLPIYILLAFLIKKKDLENLKHNYACNWDKVFTGRVWLIVYSILSFSFIFILALWKR